MVEVTDLHVLAKMSSGSPVEDDAFIIRKINSNKILYKIHSLGDLVKILSDIKPEEIFPSLCRLEEDLPECDVALWIHYVLGDAVLSAKIYNLVKDYLDDPSKLKLEVFNLCFNRYLNFQELLEYSDDLATFDEGLPPTDI
ncbi:MAG: hypothetical protein ACTSO7_08305 [Candidatus Heimdallarchaeota archaeon]